MRRWLSIAALAGLLAGCAATAEEPSRDIFGVATARPTATAGTTTPEAMVDSVLTWKAEQLCTLGYDRVRQDVVPAEEGRQLVDWELRCQPYQLTLPIVGPVPSVTSLF